MFSAFAAPPTSLFVRLMQHRIKAVEFKNIEKLTNALEFLKLELAEKFTIERKINNCRHQVVNTDIKDKNNYRKSRKGISLSRMANSHASNRAACMQFNDTKWWDELRKNNPYWHMVIGAEQAKWESHGQYGQYSTPDLVDVYKNIVPIFANWLEWARLELKANYKKIPKYLAEEYQAYLDGLTLAIEREKEAIRASFIARIRSGIRHNNLAFDDLAYAMQKRIKSLNLDGELNFPKIKAVRCTLWPKAFQSIQQIIEADSDEKEKTEFKLLLYSNQKNSDQGLVQRKTHEGKIFWVPNNTGIYIPSTRPFFTRLPNWLSYFYHNKKVAYDFFQGARCQYLLAINTNWKFKETSFDKSWRKLDLSTEIYQIERLFLALTKEEKRLEEAHRSLNSFSKKDTRCALFVYQDVLNQLAENLLDKEITMLEKILEAIKQNKIEMSPWVQNLVVKLFNYISLHSQEWSFYIGGKFLPRVAAAKKNYAELFSPVDNTPLAESVEECRERENEILPSNCERLEPTDIFDLEKVESVLTSSGEEARAEAKKMAKRIRIEKYNLSMQLDKALAVNPLELNTSNFDLHLASFKNAYLKLFELSPPKISSSDIQTKLFAYLHQFIQAIQKIESKQKYGEKAEAINLVIKMLSDLPNDNPILKHILKQLDEAFAKVHLFDWELFLFAYIDIFTKTLAQHLNISVATDPRSEILFSGSTPHENSFNKKCDEASGLQELSLFAQQLSSKANPNLEAKSGLNYSN